MNQAKATPHAVGMFYLQEFFDTLNLRAYEGMFCSFNEHLTTDLLRRQHDDCRRP